MLNTQNILTIGRVDWIILQFCQHPKKRSFILILSGIYAFYVMVAKLFGKTLSQIFKEKLSPKFIEITT